MEARIPRLPTLPRWQIIASLIIPILLYANTLTHGYAQDDDIVIRKNDFTQQGIAGIPDLFTKESFVGYFKQQKDLLEGARYRPLSMMTFAIEVQLFGPDKPGQLNQAKASFGHGVNVVMYALCCMMVLLVCFGLFTGKRFRELRHYVPFLTMIIFAVHPLHVEAVANVKGRDEILTLLLCLMALFYALRFARLGSISQLIASGVCFALALFSKENAYTWMPLIPLALYACTTSRERLVRVSATLFVITVAAILIRYQVVGIGSQGASTILENNPFLGASEMERFATVIYTSLRYLQLFLVPHPLTVDYYPYHIELQTFANPLVLLGLVVYLGMIIFMVVRLAKGNLLALGLAFFLLPYSVVSNLFLSVGTFMGERFLFMPSFGLCLVAAMLLWVGWRRVFASSVDFASAESNKPAKPKQFFEHLSRRIPISAIGLAVVLVLFGYRTVDRNADWKDNITLFLTDIEVSKGSAKANHAAGGSYFDMAQASTDPRAKAEAWAKAVQYTSKAVEINPNLQQAWLTLGSAYFNGYGRYKTAAQCYLQGGAQESLRALTGKAILRKQPDTALVLVDMYATAWPNDMQGSYLKGWAYSKKAQTIGAALGAALWVSARAALEKARSMNPDNPDVLDKLGQVYAQGFGNLEEAQRIFQHGLRVSPNNPSLLQDMGVLNLIQGQTDEALRYFLAAEQYGSTDPGVYESIAQIYAQLGKPDLSAQYRAKAAQIKAGNA